MSDALQAAEIDPGTLALFTQPAPPAGRTRGSFRMLTTEEPRRQAQQASDGQPELVRPVLAPRVQRRLAGEIDWDLVDTLRERVSAELSERDPDPSTREDVGREIIAAVLEEESRASTVRGQLTWTLDH